MNNIEIKNVTKKYDGFLLDKISFDVPAGSIVGLIGENGAGKTTTIKSILNIIKSEGTVKIFNKDINQNEKEIKQNIGVVLDDSFLSTYLTPKYINSVMKEFYKNWNEEKYNNLLKQFGLPSDKLIKDFSSGMKMKLKIATAISHNPKLLILDEPTSGLDPVVRNEILDIFRKYIEEDEERSILLSTHIAADIEAACSKTAVLYDGKVIFAGDMPELLKIGANKVYTTTLLQSELSGFKKRYPVISVHQNGEDISCRFLADEPPQIQSVPCEATVLDSYMYLLSDYKREVG